MSAVFDFSASLKNGAPVSPIMFPVNLMKMEKSGLLMDAVRIVSFVFTTQIEFCECCV